MSKGLTMNCLSRRTHHCFQSITEMLLPGEQEDFFPCVFCLLVSKLYTICIYVINFSLRPMLFTLILFYPENHTVLWAFFFKPNIAVIVIGAVLLGC